jgi:hypothetical protein
MTIVHGGTAPARAGEKFMPLDPTNRLVAAHRPLAQAIVADYGSPVDGADRVRAIVDWVARTAIHGHSELRDGMSPTANVATLPIGTDWTAVGLAEGEALAWLESLYLNHHVIEDPATAVFFAALDRIAGLDR